EYRWRVPVRETQRMADALKAAIARDEAPLTWEASEERRAEILDGMRGVFRLLRRYERMAVARGDRSEAERLRGWRDAVLEVGIELRAAGGPETAGKEAKNEALSGCGLRPQDRDASGGGGAAGHGAPDSRQMDTVGRR
ncbi:MAG: hypothetical protein N3A38_16990, partial [Planctomycetota bacterium]|nr:hypothetical protein [Planctomycetota bacterium]